MTAKRLQSKLFGAVKEAVSKYQVEVINMAEAQGEAESRITETIQSTSASTSTS
jgi:histone H3/H4